MSKIGDNSFPNAVAFLAGRARSLFRGVQRISNHSASGKHHQTEFGDVMGYFDEHPLIWKDFEKAVSQIRYPETYINYERVLQGYTTYYAEDYPSFNLFFYLAKGFRRKPVHHYFRLVKENCENR